MRKEKIEKWHGAHLLIHLQVSHQMKSHVSFIREKSPSLSSVAVIYHVRGIWVWYNIALSCQALLSGTSAIKAGKYYVDKELGLHVKCGFLITVSFGAHYYIDC